jgi:hypothetical protein
MHHKLLTVIGFGSLLLSGCINNNYVEPLVIQQVQHAHRASIFDYPQNFVEIYEREIETVPPADIAHYFAITPPLENESTLQE